MIPRQVMALVALMFVMGIADAQCEALKLAGPPPDPYGLNFGYSVCLAGDRMIVGQPAGSIPGSAITYDLKPFGWIPTAVLQASDGIPGDDDQFGYSVAIDGESAIVGAVENGLLSAKGAAYVFERTGGMWVETAKLQPSDPAAWAIGWSVALEGDRALIGAKGAVGLGTGGGLAFVFEREESGWVQAARLEPSISKSGDGFGTSVALEGDRAVLGAPYAFTSIPPFEGLAFVFERAPSGLWLETTALSPPELADGDTFGRDVALQSDTVLVSAPGHDLPAFNAGAVFAFELDQDQWIEKGKLVSSDLVYNLFGWSVDLESGYAAVGARFDDLSGNAAGAAYLFRRDGGAWTEVAKFSGSELADGDTFGHSVDMDGERILIGAPHASSTGSPSPGYAHLFRLDTGASLLADKGSVSLSQGGTQELQLGACSNHAGDTFQFGGTFSGTTPGFLYQGFLVPLNPDPYFFHTLTSPGIPLSPTMGTFDEWGRANALFTVPPSSSPHLVGLELHHAYGVLDAATRQVELVSAPVPVSLLP